MRWLLTPGLVSSPWMVARPKSTSLATPVLEIRILVPLMSRWVTPCSSEYCSPRASPSISGSACSGWIRVRSFMKSRRFIPSTYSMIMKCR